MKLRLHICSMDGILYVDGNIPWYTEEKTDRIDFFGAMNFYLRIEAKVFETMSISHINLRKEITLKLRK